MRARGRAGAQQSTDRLRAGACADARPSGRAGRRGGGGGGQAADLELLFRKYDDMGEGSVNYVAFSTDVDVTETFSSREPQPRAPVPFNPFHGGFRQPKVDETLLRAMM